MIEVERQLALPWLYPKQRDAIFAPCRTSVVEASTKTGKTVGCMAWLLSQAWTLGAPNRAFWWVAPVYPQADIAFRRTRVMLRRADPDRKIFRVHKAEKTIELLPGSRLVFKSGEKPDNLYGEDVFSGVIDEASRLREDSWYALRSTLTATRAPFRVIGNVKGRKNWFYRMARRAQDDTSGRFSYAKLTAWDAVDAGILEAAEVEEAREDLPDHVFRELYLAEPADDGGNPFDEQALRDCAADGLAEGPVVAWGVDLAKHRDWTVAIGLNADGHVCVLQRWQSDWRDTTARLRGMLRDAHGEIDATGVGDPIYEDLSRDCPLLEPCVITSVRKQQRLLGLASAFHRRKTRYPRESVLASELDLFEYEVRVVNGRVSAVMYSAPEGCHDDTVLAYSHAWAAYERLMTGGPRLHVFDAAGADRTGEADGPLSDTYDETDLDAWDSDGLCGAY